MQGINYVNLIYIQICFVQKEQFLKKNEYALFLQYHQFCHGLQTFKRFHHAHAVTDVYQFNF